ncbi:3-deoxy-manno-octulosonate cytidylyltransferase [Thermoflavimicrobium dichotomicum]|uniref:3-deoxy-manno-octulosonate cytidylyltransferase n=1 Tax=Thermoflavimicrobium dichotomicum TaxID=46223 RepID=A0A1I3LYL5_9BACL|nr:3-deoxy-manno-octulosonate cytidylyltransferase [Thermoflavimicrobium dichotomicum]SFI89869.1 3-deoxy-manno-octulosonate cytidylyltransferase (CMP-KDO synthetase) [Thermoflavimicrobium dichotomicum]
MKIVGIIPARYRSTRFPGKPIANISGKPMIWWVYQNAIKVPDFDSVYIATDDQRIEEVCRRFRMNVVMTSEKHPTGTDRVCEAAERIDADLYVNIQGDEPLVSAEEIQEAIKPFFHHPHLSVTNLMTKIKNESELLRSTVVKVVVNDKKEAIYYSRSPIPYPKGNCQPIYFKQLGIYAFSPAAIHFFSQTPQGPVEKSEEIELMRFIEHRWSVQMVEVESDSMSVDTPHDLVKVNEIMAKGYVLK